MRKSGDKKERKQESSVVFALKHDLSGLHYWSPHKRGKSVVAIV